MIDIGRRSVAASMVIAGSFLPGCAGGVVDQAALPAPSPPDAAEPVSCASPRVREPDLCRTVDVDGWSVRYAFSYAGTSQPDRVVVVDAGGPGRSELSGPGVMTLLEAMPATLDPDTYAFVVIEEPWVTAAIPESCTAVGRAHLASFDGDAGGRSGSAPTGSWAECFAAAELGWTASSYSSAVQEIERSAGVEVVGFVGASFASRRLTYLAGTPAEPAWAMLADPFPFGGNLDDVLAHQAASARALLAAAEPSTDAVTAVASAYQQLGESATADMSWEPGNAAADAYLGRYGFGDMTAGRLAYLDELCSAVRLDAYRGWDGSADDTMGFAVAFHAPCAEGSPAEPADGDVAVCVVADADDPVVPAPSTDTPPIASRYEIVEVEGTAHGDLTKLQRCPQPDEAPAET